MRKMQDEQTNLGSALGGIVRHPFAALISAWNWKSAAISALLRAAIFFATNRRAGSHIAVRAMLAEAVFAIAAAGLMGAVTQRLRATRPVWATALIVWLGLPTLMLAAQFAWHRALGTPHVRTGLIVSFCFAAISTGFNWFAMRRGVMLAGTRDASFAADIRALPRVMVDFLLVAPRALIKLVR
jgi:hypothetical protein